MFHLLFVSISFPPKNDPECLQTARYFKYLAQTNRFIITVITSSIPTLYMPKDESLVRYMTGIHQLIQIRIFESKWLNYGLRKIGLGSLLFPDSKMSFYWQWRRVLKQIKVKPDYIYSRSNPISSAFMARRLKEHFNCPWLMHMSDPWALSPLHEIPHNRLQRSLKAEKELIEAADKISFTTERTLNLYKNEYPSAIYKLTVLPNVYDPEDVFVSAIPSTKKLRVVYTGSLVSNRNVSFLLPVLNRLEKQLPAFNEMIEFIFAGDLDRTNRGFFVNSLSCIKHVGLLNHGEVKKLCLSAHILLVVDNPTSPEGAIFFPSKLLDYFLTQRKIWAVTPEGSTTRQVLTNYCYEAFQHNEYESMAHFLLRSIDQLQQGNTTSFLAAQVPAAYSAKMNATLLANTLLQKSTR